MTNQKTFPFTGILKPGDASAVILNNEAGLYLMQRRDNISGIYYPNSLGLFGGACEEGETFEETAVRELKEEISLSLENRLTFFNKVTLDFGPFGYGHVDRYFYHAVLTDEEIENIELGEGRALEILDVSVMLNKEQVVPYDAFAIWMHCNTPSQ